MSTTKVRSGSPKADYSSLVPAVEQACRVLLCLAESRGPRMSLTELATALNIHKSKAYSLLNTLQHFHFIQRDPTSKTYALGTGLLSLSSRVLNDLDIRDVAAPFLAALADEVGAMTFLGLRVSKHVVVVAKDEGTQPTGLTVRLGHRFPLAWGAHGKAIMAFLEDRERQETVDGEKLYVHGHPSVFNRVRFEREMATCRQVGFAVDPGEMQAGLHAVASPVFGPTDKLIGAMVVLGTFPISLASRYGAILARTAGEFSRRIGGVVPSSHQEAVVGGVAGTKS